MQAMNKWRKAGLALVGVGLFVFGFVQLSGAVGAGRYAVQTVKWSKYNGSGVITDSAEVWIEYAAPAAAGGEDTTQWVDMWDFKRPASRAALDTVYAAIPVRFSFQFGGSTLDTQQVELQYTDDPGAGTITTQSTKSIVGHSAVPVFWAEIAALRARYLRCIWHNVDNADAGTTGAHQVRAQVRVLEED